jgi:hypothetical protein
MSEASLPAPSRKQKGKPAKKASLFTPQNLRMAAGVLQAGLSLLEGNRKTRPYAQALRVATSIGVAGAGDSSEKIIERLAAARLQMKALEAQGPLTKEQLKQLKHYQEQVNALLDLFLEAQ